MADLQTSMNMRSPVQINQSKIKTVMDTSSIVPAESTYNNHKSMRGDNNSILGGLLNNITPDPTFSIDRNKTISPLDNRKVATMKSKDGLKDMVMDEYEDLLNTIEAETNQQAEASSTSKTNMRMSQNSLAEATDVLPSRVS